MGLVGTCSSLHSDSRVLVPVSLPSDESKRRVEFSVRRTIGFGSVFVTACWVVWEEARPSLKLKREDFST